jgi:alcohol oxidase
LRSGTSREPVRWPPTGIKAGVKIRPTDAELKEFQSWPTAHFKAGWESYFKNKPDKPVMHYSVIAGLFGDHMLM